jgi:predicted PurR-regulated permease PerM
MQHYLPKLTENQRRWARFGGVVIGFVLIAWLAYVLRNVLTLLAIAFALAYILNPVIVFFEQRGVRRVATITTLYVIGFIAFGFGVAILGTLAEAQVRDVVTNVPEKLADLQAWAVEHYPRFGNSATVADPNRPEASIDSQTRQQFAEWFRAQMPSAASGVGLASRIFSSASAFFTALAMIPMFAFFFMLQYDAFLRTIREHLPSAWRPTVTRIAQLIDDKTAEFFRVRLVICFLVGLLSGVGWLVVGVPYSLPFGAIAGVLNLVPFMSIGLFPVILIATWSEHAVSGWLMPVAGAMAVFGIVQAIESFMLYPWLSAQTESKLHPVTTIVALLIGAELAGALGMLLSIPIASTLKAVAEEYWLPEINRLANRSAAPEDKPPPDEPTDSSATENRDE